MIYIIWAPPRSGKTYFATHIVLQKMRKGINCYTNYPVFDGEKSSFKWMPDMIYENVQDAIIVIDEAYREFSSREYRLFDKDKHTWFATNGHNNNDIYVIAQNPARVDVIIREMCNVFYYVEKTEIPIIGRPFWFRVYGYLDESSMATRDPALAWTRERILFRKKVARAYDTHYYRNNDPPYQGECWTKTELLNIHEVENLDGETLL